MCWYDNNERFIRLLFANGLKSGIKLGVFFICFKKYYKGLCTLLAIESLLRYTNIESLCSMLLFFLFFEIFSSLQSLVTYL